MISTSYPSSDEDWKGQFIKQLACNLANSNEIDLRLWAPPGSLPDNIFYCATKKQENWLQNLAAKGGIAHLIRKKPLAAVWPIGHLIRQLHTTYLENTDVNLVHVNWLQNAFPLWGTNLPAVISVLGSDFALLKVPGMVKMLRHVLRNRKVALCPNAKWMEKDLKTYFGDLANISYVPFGIEQQWYDIKPLYNSTAPKKWVVVLRVTRKKIGPLFEWGKDIFNSQEELHLFGPMQEDIPIPQWVHYHGATYPEVLVENWFPQATGFISLSEHNEGRPQILLEAMASSLPIIASDIFAHKDLLNHKESGLIVNSKDSFRSAVAWLRDEENRIDLSTKAKQWVKSEIGTWEDCAQRYLNIYHSILGDT